MTIGPNVLVDSLALLTQAADFTAVPETRIVVADDRVPWLHLMALHAQRPQTTRVSDNGHELAKRICFGATVSTVSLMILRYMYNDLDGGSLPIFRNYVNACAVVTFALGATTVAYASQSFTLSESAMQWHRLTDGIVFTTLQIQDLCKEEGDRERGRSTIPILCGDSAAHWTVVLPRSHGHSSSQHPGKCLGGAFLDHVVLKG